MAAERAAIRIAPLRPSERARWGQLWGDYQRFYRVEIPAAATESTWQCLHDGKVHGLGARGPADVLVGFVHFLYHQDTWSTAPACYLQDLYVEPHLRGTGCGRKLIEAVAAAASAAGANAPYWLTHTSNTVARQLYERLGRNHGFIQYVYQAAADSAPYTPASPP
jgi:GNAT superfamily N-acetyltransferase